MRDSHPLGARATLDDLDGPFADLLERASQFLPRVGAVGENMTQPRGRFAEQGEESRRAVAILDPGLVNHESEQQAIGIGDDMTLAPVDLLARVIATRTAAFRGFHRLRVDHAGRGRGLAAGRQTRRHDQAMVDAGP